jgi:hypothetical protein
MAASHRRATVLGSTMSLTVCLVANTLPYLEGGGGHLWVYLNWALGLRALGCRVLWLEAVRPETSPDALRESVAALKSRLHRYGLAECLALCPRTDASLPQGVDGHLDLDAVSRADLLLNLVYGLPRAVVERFRRTALVDIDPGLLQIWISKGDIEVAPHDVYFTIGETVGHPGSECPDAGLRWTYTPPCVALNWWPLTSSAIGTGAAFTTVSHWYAEEWVEWNGDSYRNDKQTGFLPFLDLPQHASSPLELAICMRQDDEEWAELRRRGWRVRHAWDVASTPWEYQQYIQNSLGEFSCTKPAYVHLQNAWISDRTLCYLASGKPVVVQHTGPSRFLPDAGGLFRFRTMHEAVVSLEAVMVDYERHSRLARALAEEYFDAAKVVGRVLERALT